jgi:broad specificity phosphatase PhoE
MKNVITIQHTQAIHHNNGMVGSWTDWELTELGHEQAENIGKRLSAELRGQEYKIYSSDLLRARQTAGPIARYLGVEVEYRVELRELNLGAGIGKTLQWLRENGQPVKMIDDRSFPDAESAREVWDRLSAFCDQIIAGAAENIIIVSHGFALGLWPSVWLGLDVQTLDRAEFGGMTGGVSFMSATTSGKRVLHRINDLSYVK